MKKVCILAALLLAGCTNTTKEDALSCLMDAGISTDTVLLLHPMNNVAYCHGVFINGVYPLNYKRYSIEQRKYIGGCVVAQSSEDKTLSRCFVSEALHEFGDLNNFD